MVSEDAGTQKMARILVVDDDTGVRSLLEALLSREGYEVLTASTGEEALTKYDSETAAGRTIDLTLTDYDMPGITGLDVLKTIKQKDRNAPVFVVTGRGSEDVAEQAFKLRASQYVKKPFNNKDLVSRVNDVIEEKKERDELERMARLDSLTGVYNANSYERILNLAVKESKPYGNSMGVIYIDLNNFKETNDKRGHSEGDNLLREFGKILRDSDYCVRKGGDEFVIFCPGLKTKEQAQRIVDGIKQKVTDYNSGVEDQLLKIEPSFGFALGNQNYNELVRTAEKNMYVDKGAAKRK